MVIATPFAGQARAPFDDNQKINCLSRRGRGGISTGRPVRLDREDGSTAVLDWGRGVWTYQKHLVLGQRRAAAWTACRSG